MNRRIVISLILVVLIPFTLMVWIRTHQSSGFAGLELIIYPLAFGSAGIFLMWLAKRFLLKEKLAQLNSGPGKWQTDIMWGLGLTLVYFILFYVNRQILSDILEFRSNQELLGLMLDMRESWILLIVWFGPVLWIGIAFYEELLRVFFLDGIWRLGKGPVWIAFGIVLAAAYMGFAHISQGPYGIVTIAIKSLVSGYFYYKIRRLFPLVLAHVLYDGIQVALLLITYPA